MNVKVKGNDYGMVPLHYAALNGHVEVVKLLWCRYNAKNNNGRACRSGWAHQGGEINSITQPNLQGGLNIRFISVEDLMIDIKNTIE